MSGGNNSAKEMVIKEAERLADDLQNGSAGDQQTLGRATSHIIKMIVPMYRAEFVTVDDCKKNRSKEAKISGTSKIKIGNISLEGPIVSRIMPNSGVIVCVILVAYMVGKTEGWW